MESSVFRKKQNCNRSQPSTIPFPDESIIANLDNIISVFQNSSDNKYPSQDELAKTLEDLKSVRNALENINVAIEQLSSDKEVSSNASSNAGSDEVVLNNEIIRSSIDMLKNGGKFTKLVDNQNCSKKSSESSGNSSTKRESKDSARNALPPTRSSLLNSMTVSSCPLSHRKSPRNNKRITRKISRELLLKKADKKVNQQQQQQQPSLTTESKIIGTYYATCRIHRYEDNSHTFEIINPKRVNCFGDGNDKSEIVVVVLRDGRTALFTTKSSKSFTDILSFGESQ